MKHIRTQMMSGADEEAGERLRRFELENRDLLKPGHLPQPARLHQDDFFLGMLMALAKINRKKFSTKGTGLHLALERLMPDLEHMADQQSITLDFRIRTQSFHGTSGTVYEMIQSAVRRDLGVESDGMFYINAPDEVIERMLEVIPGSPEMYLRLARQLTMDPGFR